MHREEINVAPEHFNALVTEFSTTRTSVYSALGYKTHSKMAVDIRRRAKEMLLAEAKRVRFEIKKKNYV